MFQFKIEKPNPRLAFVLCAFFLSLVVLVPEASAITIVGAEVAPPERVGCSFNWNRDLRLGSSGNDVLRLQSLLNSDPATALNVSPRSAGSPGNETSYFGPATQMAVIKFQEKNRTEILNRLSLTQKGTGFVGPLTRSKLSSLCGGVSVETGGLKILETSQSIGTTNIQVTRTNEIQRVNVMTFDLVAEGSDLTLTELPVQIISGRSFNLAVIKQIELYREADLIATKNVPNLSGTSTVTFKELKEILPKDIKQTFTIKANIENTYSDNLSGNNSVKMTIHGNQIVALDIKSNNAMGSRIASSMNMIFRTKGVSIEVLDTAEFIVKDTETDEKNGIFKIKYKVDAFGEDAYVVNNATNKNTTDYGVGEGNIYTVTGTSTISAAGLTSTAPLRGTSYLVANGTSETFTLTVVLSDGEGFSQIELKTIEFKNLTSNSEFYPTLEDSESNPLYISISNPSPVLSVGN